MEPKVSEDPMRPCAPWQRGLALAQSATRCGARTRRQTSCQAAAMPNGRCRMHGGASTGPRTVEGLERLRAARTKHGLRSAAASEVRDLVRALKAKTKQLVELV